MGIQGLINGGGNGELELGRREEPNLRDGKGMEKSGREQDEGELTPVENEDDVVAVMGGWEAALR